jgi:glycerol-3-phosphate acyltransferase PlsY
MLSYFVGAIPTGYWICKLFFKIDVTQYGSGNIGATNVARVLGGIRYFFIIFLIDAIKAFVMLYLTDFILQSYLQDFTVNARQQIMLICGAALLVGNALSVFLRFKGGKGVATTVGILLYLVPGHLIMLFILAWLLILGLTRRVFLASVGSAFVFAAFYGLLYSFSDALFPFFCVLFLWILIRHKDNFRRFYSH